MPASMFKAVCRILQEQGYIEDFVVERRAVGLMLRVRSSTPTYRKPVIQGLERVSMLVATYVQSGTIPKVQGGLGMIIVSTSRGVMTGHDAKRAGVGGEPRRATGETHEPNRKQLIAVPSGVEVTIEPELVKVKGPKGELSERVDRSMEVKQETARSSSRADGPRRAPRPARPDPQPDPRTWSRASRTATRSASRSRASACIASSSRATSRASAPRPLAPGRDGRSRRHRLRGAAAHARDRARYLQAGGRRGG